MGIKGLRNLCTPAQMYLVISLVALVVMIIQNYYYNFTNTYCLGSYSCSVSSIFLIFVIKALYILFWTWILNLICNAGAPGIAWFLVLIPFILMFILLALMMI